MRGVKKDVDPPGGQSSAASGPPGEWTSIDDMPRNAYIYIYFSLYLQIDQTFILLFFNVKIIFEDLSVPVLIFFGVLLCYKGSKSPNVSPGIHVSPGIRMPVHSSSSVSEYMLCSFTHGFS
jgi:hypothetical protein